MVLLAPIMRQHMQLCAHARRAIQTQALVQKSYAQVRRIK